MRTVTLYFLTALNFLNYLDRYLVASMLPILMMHFSLTNEQGGRLQSAFVLGYVVFSPLFGYFGDRFRRPMLMALGAALWSLATVGSGLAGSFAVFLCARILVGAGEASFGTAAPAYLKDALKNPLAVNRAMAIFYSAIPVGSALGYVVGGWLSAQFDWRWAFIIAGTPGLLLALIVSRLPEVQREVCDTTGVREGLLSIARVPVLWFAIGGYVLNAFALNGIATFIVPYGIQLGFSQEGINQSFGLILVLTGFVGTLGGGRLSAYFAGKSKDPVASMLRFIGISGLIAAPFLGASFMVSTGWLFLLLCFVAELLIFAGVAAVNSVLVLACPRGTASLTQGVTILTINLFGALLSPVLIGFTADQTSLALALQLATVALIGSGLVWLWGGVVTDSTRKVS